MTIDERTSIAEEAKKLEAAGADWHAKHVAAVLGCAVKTVYDTPWLKRVARKVGRRGVRFTPAEVRRAQSIASS
jgi:hypothetical protein